MFLHIRWDDGNDNDTGKPRTGDLHINGATYSIKDGLVWVQEKPGAEEWGVGVSRVMRLTYTDDLRS